MAWYKTGTVSITNGSPLVTGFGTSWVDAGILNSGDILLAPDGKEYEVLSIQSNTGLTLSTNYLGTTATGASYSLIPIGLLPSSLALQVKSTLSTANTALSSTIRYDINSMGLTSVQQQNARTNIAALGASDVGNGYSLVSVAGNANVTLSASQGNSAIIELTGTLTGNISVITSVVQRSYLVKNSTTGAFTLTFIGSSGSGVVVPQGSTLRIACDGTNMFDTGAIANISGGTIAGITSLQASNLGIGSVGLSYDAGRLRTNAIRVTGTYTFMPPVSVVNYEAIRFYNTPDQTGQNTGSFSIVWNSATQLQIASYTYGTGITATSIALQSRTLFGTTTDDGVSSAQGVSASFGTISAGTPGPSTMGSNTVLRAGVSGGAGIGGMISDINTAVDTGIPVNQGTFGGALIFVASRNTSNGLSTDCAVYIIHFYYDGNNTPTAVYLGGSSNFLTFGVSAANTLTVTNATGNASYSWFGNK